MIKDNQQQFNRLRALLDAITIAISYFVAYALFFHVIDPHTFFGGRVDFLIGIRGYMIVFAVLLPLHMVLYACARLYRPMRVTGRRIEAFKVLVCNIIALMLPIVFFFLFMKYYSTHFSRMFLVEFGVLNTFLIILQRNLLRYIVRGLRKKGYNKKHILLVGYSKSCEGLLDRVSKNKAWGYQVFGVLDDRKDAGTSYKEYKVIGKTADLASILENNFIDEVFVTLRLKEYEKLEGIVQACEKAGVMTKFVPDYGSLMSNKPYTEDLLGLPVVYIRQVPLNDNLNAFMKRAMDIFGSLFAIILFSPVMLVTAIAVKASSPGPIIFKQERVGLHNKPFYMYKFRSMGVQRDADEAKGWTTKNDPRVTKVGKFIRKTSIDELPQLFNVLTGSMSMIGPRPERPQFVEKFKEEIPRYMVKHQVRPGMTGWAQVNGLRGDTSIEDRIEHDLYYIENWTLGLDFKILFLTFFKGFVNKNAY